MPLQTATIARDREITFHDHSPTGATLMIGAGRHVKVIAEQIGHSDGGGLVLKRYGHVRTGTRPQAATVLEARIFGSSADRSVRWTGD